LARHRHIRELRQTAGDTEPASVFWLDGEALCVTAHAPPSWRECPPTWLTTHKSTDGRPRACQRVERLVVAVPGTPEATLVRRRTNWPLAWIWSWLWGVGPAAPEIRQAGLIFRLQRYCIEAPRLIAFGQRHFPPWRTDSFLLTEGSAGAVNLADWLSVCKPGDECMRRDLLRQAGALVRRMHEAGCRLFLPTSRSRPYRCPLIVRTGAENVPVIAVGTVEGITARGKRGARVEHRDMVALLDRVSTPTWTRTDRLRFLLGYLDVRRLGSAHRHLGRLLLRPARSMTLRRSVSLMTLLRSIANRHAVAAQRTSA
jgi:hypothetical protein